MTQYLVALSAIVRSPKDGPTTEMMGYDEKTGEPIIRATAEHIRPGEFFTEDNHAEAAWLLKHDAVRIPTDGEVDLWKSGVRR